MDEPTQKAVTQALDTAIATVTEEWLERLSCDLSAQEIAEKVCKALKSLDRLRSPDPLGCSLPDYGEWDALFYAVWYQPSQINLAYYLVLEALQYKNPLLSGTGRLEVVDFGCGAFAMQIGLALAATDLLKEGRTNPKISIDSQDKNDDMWLIGSEIWDCLVDKHAKNCPELDSLYRICRSTNWICPEDSEATRWLTALHVAYEKNHVEVKENLNALLQRWSPHLVLTTTPSSSVSWIYSPDHASHKKFEYMVDLNDLPLGHGSLDATTAFRKRLYRDLIESKPNYLCADDMRFVKAYLTYLPTKWLNDNFFPKCFFHYRL